MLVSDFAGGQWQSPQILPFGNWSIAPTALAFHYGQTIFEGMKAFRTVDGRVQIFRIQKHYDRMARSAERLCMPMVSRELFTEGMKQLVSVDQDWVPKQEGSALYIRPFIIATEARLRASISDEYRFSIVTNPTGSYYSHPVRVKVERDFNRAPKGGTGYAKCGGNYGGAFYPSKLAKEQGYDQILWTDSRENKYIEEAGTMNAAFVIGGTLVTPPLSDSILDGVTRDSILKLAKDAGIPVKEQPISVDELRSAFEKGQLKEAFGIGTAAVISLIGAIGIDGVDYEVPAVTPDNISQQVKTALDDLRYGRTADPYGWNEYID